MNWELICHKYISYSNHFSVMLILFSCFSLCISGNQCRSLCHSLHNTVYEMSPSPSLCETPPVRTTPGLILFLIFLSGWKNFSHTVYVCHHIKLKTILDKLLMVSFHQKCNRNEVRLILDNAFCCLWFVNLAANWQAILFSFSTYRMLILDPLCAITEFKKFFF